MKLKNFSKLAILPVLILTGAVLTAAPVKDSGTYYAEKALKPFVDSGELPCCISVLYNNGLQEVACFGYIDKEKKHPVNLDTVFMQASQTKGFVGVCLAMLIEQGKISLNDPVYKYLPEFKKMQIKGKNGKLRPAKKTITIKMLANHTWGRGSDQPRPAGYDPDKPLSIQDEAKYLASLPLEFEPGTKVKYSIGLEAAIAIIEKVSGESWIDFLQKHLLDPLEIKEATFNPTPEQISRMMPVYSVQAGKKAKPYPEIPELTRAKKGIKSNGRGSGRMWITVNDQLKFYKMLMNLGLGDNGVRILKEETVKKLLLTNSRPAGMGSYSLGLSVKPSGWVGHGGAYATSCIFNWKTKQIRLWAVQYKVTGVKTYYELPWFKAWAKAAEEFFGNNVDDSAVNAYTGRTK